MAEAVEGVERQQPFVAVEQVNIAGFKGHRAGRRVRDHLDGNLFNLRLFAPVALVTHQHVVLIEF